MIADLFISGFWDLQSGSLFSPPLLVFSPTT
jgi:hypothetical protein